MVGQGIHLKNSFNGFNGEVVEVEVGEVEVVEKEAAANKLFSKWIK